MSKSATSFISEIISKSANSLLADWLAGLAASPDPRIPAAEQQEQCESIVLSLTAACRGGNLTDIGAPSYEPLRDTLIDLSLSRALQGFSPTEMATFVLSLKAPLFVRLRGALESDPERLAAGTLTVSELIDALALFMLDRFQRTREELVLRQQGETFEVATPVVRLWQGIVAMPLIGKLDFARAWVVMENLLDSIARHQASIAIIDVTSIPAIDIPVAQHLLKTVDAARLMGADCIISGIRPQIAQTMVHLGLQLNATSTATLSDAFAVALRRLGKTVVSERQAETT
jgi:rsbT co-antagonist protein RsbR